MRACLLTRAHLCPCMYTCVSLCVHVPVLPGQVPHLLVVDVGQDASDDLQQKDEEEQDEVLGMRGDRLGGVGADTPVP